MRKQLIVLSALFVGITAFGQKKELKVAEKAVNSADYKAAISALDQVKSLIDGADDKLKAKYYFLRGKAVYGDGTNKADYEAAGKAFNELIDFEEKIKKYKYSEETAQLLNAMIGNIAQSANASYNSKDYKTAVKDFYTVFSLSPKDTSFLENAALAAYFGKENQRSNELYQELLDLGYTGIYTEYKAISKTDGKPMRFNTKADLDQQVKFGLVENPEVKVHKSRRGNIVKMIAFNHIALGDKEKALTAIQEARKSSPDDYDLLINEANIYFQLGNNEMFKERLEQAVELNPTDPTLHYNIGVMNLETGNVEDAVKAFNKAIELKPDYADAYNNVGAAILGKAEKIVEEMNKNLSNFDKYDKLQAEQLAVYKEALPYYEKAFELNKTSKSTIQTLIGIYENLEMYDKQKEMRAVLDALEN